MARTAISPAQAQDLTRAFQNLQNGNTKAALATAQRVVASAAQNPDAQHLLALCLGSAGQAQGAEAAFKAALALAPTHHQILSNFGNFLKRSGRSAEALAPQRQAVAAQPNFVQGWINLGLTALDVGALDEAEAALQKACDLAPRTAAAYHAMSSVHRRRGHLDKAADTVRKAIEIDPKNGRAWHSMAVIARLSGRPHEAFEHIAKARGVGLSDPELDDFETGVHLDRGDVDAALASADRVVEAYPTFASGHDTRARILWEHGDAMTPGEDPTAKLAAAAHAHPERLDLSVTLAAFLVEAKRIDDALPVIRSLRDRSDQPGFQVLEANALEIAGDSDAARLLYENLHRINGDREPAFLNAYARHLLKRGDYDLAAKRAEAAVGLDPDNQEAWAYLGTAWRLLDDPREHWLFDYERSISFIETTAEAGEEFLPRLLAEIDPMHSAVREPVNQSLRGGSQTAGRLFGRPSKVIAKAERAFKATVENAIAAMPDDDSHPF